MALATITVDTDHDPNSVVIDMTTGKFSFLAKFTRKYFVAQNKLLQREQHIKALEAKIEENAPKVLFADSVATSKQSILVGQMAKILRQNGMDIGQQRLFQRLRDEGFLCSTRGERYNTPTQRAMDMKLFEIKETTVVTPDGTKLRFTTKVTPKGQLYFVHRYLTA